VPRAPVSSSWKELPLCSAFVSALKIAEVALSNNHSITNIAVDKFMGS
jgi:hypothetical protein